MRVTWPRGNTICSARTVNSLFGKNSKLFLNYKPVSWQTQVSDGDIVQVGRIQKLFISFTGTLREILLGNVSEEDLREGLFIFGCTRDYAFNPYKFHEPGERTEIEWFYEKNPQEGKRVHKMILDAILLAESQRRALWRDEDHYVTFEMLNGFIKTQGFPTLPGPDCEMRTREVVKKVQEAKLPLIVVGQS